VGVAERRARRAGTKRGDADARGDAERGADAERGEAAAAGRARRVVALDDGQQRGVLVRGHGARVFSLSALFGRTEEARGANRRSKRRRFLVARRSAGNDASRELGEPRVRREPRVARCSLWGAPATRREDTRSRVNEFLTTRVLRVRKTRSSRSNFGFRFTKCTSRKPRSTLDASKNASYMGSQSEISDIF
jgi:hypothetical protein